MVSAYRCHPRGLATGLGDEVEVVGISGGAALSQYLRIARNIGADPGRPLKSVGLATSAADIGRVNIGSTNR